MAGREGEMTDYEIPDEVVAEACHEAIRVLQRHFREPNQAPVWARTAEDIRKINIAGVRAARSGLMTARSSHELWLENMREAGWRYGPEKDVEKKTHPNMVPYLELPPFQRYKNAFFLSTITSLTITP